MTGLLIAVECLLRVAQVLICCMFIFMFLPFDRESGTVVFLRTVTEPLLAPIRALLSRFGLSRELQHMISPIALLLIFEILILLLR